MSIKEYIELEFADAPEQPLEFQIELVEALSEGQILIWCGGYVIDHESDGRDNIL
jgi:hypothetical protein